MPAVFDNDYVRRINGSNVKTPSSKLAAVEAIRSDIRRFKEENSCDRLVMVWCASTEKFITESEAHRNIENFVGALHDDDENIAPSMIYAYAALMERVPFINGAPNLTVDVTALEKLARDQGVPICGKDFKTGQTSIKDRYRSDAEGQDAWFERLVLDEHTWESGRRGPGRAREFQDEGRVEAGGAGIHTAARPVSRPV